MNGLTRVATGAMAWALVLGVGLSGCASHQAITQFSGETTRMTAAVRQEIQQVARLCVEVADVRILLAEASLGEVKPVRELKAGCERTAAATGTFQQVTVDTLDLYAKTLLALVDDKAFEVEAAVQTTTTKLGAWKDQDGQALVGQPQVAAVGQLLGLLADVTVRAEREAGIRQLVAAAPDLVALARVLRAFFVDERQQSDYDGWLTTTSQIAKGGEIFVQQGKPLAIAEPIRTAEMRRQMAVTRAALDARLSAPGRVGPVPAKIVAALDAWIAAVPVFQQQALKPDPRELRDRMKDLRAQLMAAREALAAGF